MVRIFQRIKNAVRTKRKFTGTTRREYDKTKQALLIWLLLLGGDIETNPGPWYCSRCREGMVKFEDYVRYHNNADVIGFVEAVEKIVANEKANGLDIFKESVSLPGLTQSLFLKLSDDDDYFVGFAEQHKHLTKLLRNNIVGVPSIIFHRYHEKDVTMIKGKHLCKKVIGFDANSLHLHCFDQNMPTGYYVM